MLDQVSRSDDALRKRRAATWFLTIVFVHTVPVPFFAVQVAGFVPAIALLAVGVGSVSALNPESLSLGLLALLPGLLFTAILWGLAALSARQILARLQHVPLHHVSRALGIIALVCFGLALLPVFAMGGHGSTANSNVLDLFAGTSRYPGFLIAYLVTTTGVLGMLLLESSGVLWPRYLLNRRVSTAVVLTVAGTLLWNNHALLICKPVALQGYAWAQYCVGKAALPKKNVTGGHNPWLDPPGEVPWLEMAAAQGHTGALRLLVERTYIRDGKENWLRSLAQQGDAEAQFELYRLLVNRDAAPGRIAEGYRWARLSAEALYPEAVEHLVYVSNSNEIIPADDLQRLIERAAQAGMSLARFVLASRLDNPLHPEFDQTAAKRAFQQLARDADTEKLRQHATRRVDDITSLERALAEGDAEILHREAARRLHTQAHERTRREGLLLLERAATAGQLDALKNLLRIWERGGYGFPPAPQRAIGYIQTHAAAGRVEAMELIAEGHYRGEHGFEIDYALARDWIDRLITHYELSGEHQRVKNLRRYRDRIDRKSKDMILQPVPDLLESGRQGDAESAFQAARQLALYPSRKAQLIELYGRAAELAHPGAHYELYRVLAPNPEQYPLALSHLQTAAGAGHFDAGRKLADAYYLGQLGLERDYARALSAYRQLKLHADSNRFGWNLDSQAGDYRYLTNHIRQMQKMLDQVPSQPL